MKAYQCFATAFEVEGWIIKSALKDMCLYINLDEYYQEGLIGFWEAYERFDSSKGASFRTFAYWTIRGKLLTYLKKADRNEERKAFLSDAVIESTPDEQLRIPLESELISTYCIELTEAQKTWVYKAFIEDKSAMQIAKEEGVSLETVKSWRRYALKKIRIQIERNSL
ncbi:sigma-70 family RNA polymerase sigma factor [Bacillus sp. AK128]